MAGLTKPAWLQGVPVSLGRDEVFAEVNWHGYPEPMRSVRTSRYKYIRRYLLRRGSDNCDASVSRTLLRQHGWDEEPRPLESLFDLAFDPHEANNLLARRPVRRTLGEGGSVGEGGVGDPAYSSVLSDMRARLARWMRATKDPVLAGRIEPRPGMLVRSGEKDVPRGHPIQAEPIIVEEGA